jgi:hypothetical protein
MSFTNKAEDTAEHAKDATKDLAKQSSGVVSALHNIGIRSEYAYAAGIASIGLSYASYFISRGKSGDSKAQSDRWGIFIGHWAPTFFALGIALKLEEEN